MILLFSALGLLAAVVAYDLVQRQHAILRNFPIVGHFRYWLEAVGPELRQYIVTSNNEERPFSRDQRRWVYTSSKRENNYFGFGSDQDMELQPSFLVIKHSTFPLPTPAPGDPAYDPSFTIPCAKVLGAARRRAKAFRPPSIVNVSGMSFGSLSGPAVEALNGGSRIAGCLHNTGEGGVSPYHLQGGDLVWQLGTGYFGCRDADGRFSMTRLKETVERCPQIRAIEIKLSQGAKPGLGGLLPQAKISVEIAETRGIPRDRDCASPTAHSAFGNADELLDFVESLAAATGLPVGIKSAVGESTFWADLARLMSTGTRGVDFITIDGGEGGTGAGPLVFTDHVALPFKIGFSRVQKIFHEEGLHQQVVFAGSGKLGFPEAAVFAFALGCDLINVGREALLAIGCIQAQRCHTNHCPTGITTQHPWLIRGLDATLEAVPSVVESRWRLLPGCSISRVLIRKERPPMKKPYTIVPDASTPSSRELADWLAKDGQLLVPLVELLEKGERAIDEVIDVMGRATVEAVLKMSAEQVAGPKEQGRRDADRELYWHGVQAGRVALKERQLRVAKPRLRKKRPRAGESGEVEIPAYTALQGNRRLADRMLELMLHGVSTRKYEPVLPAMAEQVGISKSEVSRETIEAGTRVLQELAERDLSELDVLVVYLDGIQFADYHVLAAVGVDADGRKHVLGLCGGASENTTVTIGLLEDLVTRGLRADRRRLFVIDGAQALRKAIGQVFGSSHLVQRCRNHKLRNVLGHLPKDQQEQARSTLRAAWKLDAEEGIRKLEQYASWLEREWPSAAASLREGLAELFTVNRLGLPQSLRRCLTTTNIIDSSHAGVRQHTDRVSRWRNEEMAVRWAAVTFRETEKHYRRITGYEHLWMLKAHLDEEKDGVLAGMQKVG